MRIEEIDAQYVIDTKNKIKKAVSRWLFGLEEPIEKVSRIPFVCIPRTDKITRQKVYGQAHILFEGKTGIGKTDMASSLAFALDAVGKRVQGTPHTLPYDILGGQSSHFVASTRCGRSRVWSEDYVIQINQTGGKLWLILKNVERRTADDAALKRFYKRRFVYHRSARCIYEICRLFHEREALCVYEMLR